MNNHHYIQYHNADSLGRFPSDIVNFDQKVETFNLNNSIKFDSWIYTKKKTIEKAIGGTCFIIVGKTEFRIKKYFLWSYFRIEEYSIDSEKYYSVSGTGCDLSKPILLNELGSFLDFKNFCGNFGLGFQNIDNHSFCKTLVSFTNELNLLSKVLIENDAQGDLILALNLLSKEMEKITPEKRIAEIELTLRNDRKIVELIKKSANFKCQFPNCISEILTKAGTFYVEVAHIRPVHKGGQSIIGNLIVLCPNHHKEFDYGNLIIDEQSDTIIKGSLNQKEFIINLTI